jgi:hypothetical protein
MILENCSSSSRLTGRGEDGAGESSSSDERSETHVDGLNSDLYVE